jgi:hypothetical protein
MEAELSSSLGSMALSAADFEDASSVVPVRLDDGERRLLQLLEGALNVSDYTDQVDVPRLGYGSGRSKDTRIKKQLQSVLSILSGLLVSSDYTTGNRLVSKETFAESSDFFQAVFEAGRRYKIMNPTKLRSVHGKMMYLLQDAASPDIQRALGFPLTTGVRTVRRFLEEKGGLALLSDDLLSTATGIPASGLSREQILAFNQEKEIARQQLCKKFTSDELDEGAIRLVMQSFSDSHEYIEMNVAPVEAMIQLLTHNFNPADSSVGTSLQIRRGKGGSKLSHSHEMQFTFVLQSLMLWKSIARKTFVLWIAAENDMLRNGYRLVDTGQGFNRLQSAPNVSRVMQSILGDVQRRVGRWVGLSVVHLGDRDVPNALMFIDKYTQVR